MREPLIVRYQMFCDDQSGDAKDELRLAELVCSLTSLKLHVEPSTSLRVIIYSLPPFIPRLRHVLGSFSFEQSEVLDTTEPEYEDFAETIQHCTPVDRMCIRRMLADFTRLPVDHPRLLLGTDIIFQRPPAELFRFLSGQEGKQVLYMADVASFGGRPYRLTYHHGALLPGLLGDFYCLAPGVSLDPEQIRGCLRSIDAWPPLGRWDPHPAAIPVTQVHACEQQAAAILLARFAAQQLPTDTYVHEPPATSPRAFYRSLTVLHAHWPWALLFRGALNPELSEQVLTRWKALGLQRAVRAASLSGAALQEALVWGKWLVRGMQRAIHPSPQLKQG